MLNLVAVSPVAEEKASLAAWLASRWDEVAFVGPTMRLYTNNLTPGPASVLADFVEAGFGGYGDQSIALATWGTVRIMPDGSSIVTYNVIVRFQATNGVTPETCYGFYIMDGATTGLLLALRFGTPLVMDAAGKFIDVELALVMPPLAPAGAADVTSNG